MLRYFEFADEGADFDAPRCVGRVYLRGTGLWDFGRGAEIINWNVKNVLRLADTAPLQDMPWIITIGILDVVSDSLKEFLEDEAPGCVQFLPLRAFYERDELPKHSYWVANWLRVVDCIDWRLSKVRNKDPKVKLIWPRIIDLNKTGNAPLLIVKEQPGLILIRSDIKQGLQQQGMTGCQFGEIEQHD